ncbi:hypothetical protein D3C77_656960 [compost metagenome]
MLEYHFDLPRTQSDEGSADPTPTCARLVIEDWLAGKVSGQGLLAPEVCLDAEAYVHAFACESGATFISTENTVKRHLHA